MSPSLPMPSRGLASRGARPGLPRRAWLATLLAAGLPWATGCAAPAPPRTAVDGRWLSLEVVERDRDRDPGLRVWHHHGDAWVAGAPGERYALRVTNRSGERMLAVVAVDGVNIVTGETASTQQRGYVLGPWQSTLLTGWRKSDSEVAAFEFTRRPQSYAALTGRPADVGVIGVAVFREAPRPVAIDLDRRVSEAASARSRSDQPPPGPLDGGMSSQPSPAQAASPPPIAANAAPEQGAPPDAAGKAAKDTVAPGAPARERRFSDERLGTGHGARESSWVTTVPFERASTTPEERLQLRYDRLDNLVAAGIVPRSYAVVVPERPRAFPEDGHEEGYVPDPPVR